MPAISLRDNRETSAILTLPKDIWYLSANVYVHKPPPGLVRSRVCARRRYIAACRFDTRGGSDDNDDKDDDDDDGDGEDGVRNTLLIPSSRFRQIHAFH